jgi:uncharacterized protein with PQ loop repeat
MIAIIGWVAALGSVFSSAPQAIELLIRRNRHGVQSWTYVLWLATVLWWIVFGVSTNSWQLIVAEGFQVPFLVAVLVMVGVHFRQVAFIGVNIAAMAGVWYIAPHWSSAAAVILGVLVALPSLREVLTKGADLSGTSAATWALVTVVGIAWMLYFIGRGYPASGINGLVSSICAAVVVIQVLRFRSAHRPNDQTAAIDIATINQE